MAQVELFARTEVGCIRERNEDAFLVVNVGEKRRGLTPKDRLQSLGGGGVVMAVCDGMGGAAGGDLAAKMASDELAKSAVQPGAPKGGADIFTRLKEAAGRANRVIADHARLHPEFRGMGCTMTAAWAQGRFLHLLHVGDSRAYLCRRGTLLQLSSDHSVTGQMVANGQLSPEQARNYEHRNVLLQAIGVEARFSPQLVTVPLQAEDRLLICSDGLTGPLPDAQILAVMMAHQDPMRCCRALTESACAAGGTDNVTAVIANFSGQQLPRQSAPDQPPFMQISELIST